MDCKSTKNVMYAPKKIWQLWLIYFPISLYSDQTAPPWGRGGGNTPFHPLCPYVVKAHSLTSMVGICAWHHGKPFKTTASFNKRLGVEALIWSTHLVHFTGRTAPSHSTPLLSENITKNIEMRQNTPELISRATKTPYWYLTTSQCTHYNQRSL